MKSFKKAGLLFLFVIVALVFISCPTEPKLEQKYTVTFDSDGGSPVEAQKLSSGGQVERPKDSVKENLCFAGWYTADGKLYDFDYKFVYSDFTLKAKWQAEVTYNANGGKNKFWIGEGRNFSFAF